jgi:hypothetical protein
MEKSAKTVSSPEMVTPTLRERNLEHASTGKRN